jgi:2-dehydropantoate 2-reductase
VEASLINRAISAAAEGVPVDKTAALRDEGAVRPVGVGSGSGSGSHLASMLQDLMNGRPMEIAHLNGAIAERAAKHGIDAPANGLIARLIRLLEATRPHRVNSLHADAH